MVYNTPEIRNPRSVRLILDAQERNAASGSPHLVPWNPNIVYNTPTIRIPRTMRLKVWVLKSFWTTTSCALESKCCVQYPYNPQSKKNEVEVWMLKSTKQLLDHHILCLRAHTGTSGNALTIQLV
jgi:hypothetical protein